MEINLNYLKFHYFKLDKNIHNLSVKKFDDFFDKLLFDEDKNSLKNILKKVKEANNYQELEKISTHFHQIQGVNKYTITDVIKKEHKNLYFALSQLFENEEIKFYQLKLINECRLVFVLKRYDVLRLVFIPILFDINHCFYKNKYRNYDKGELRTCKWDLKNKQKDIKKKLLK